MRTLQGRKIGSTNVRILPPISARFVRSRSLRPHSAKTYENPAHGTACRKTVEFPVPVTAALIGGFNGIAGNRLRIQDRDRHDSRLPRRRPGRLQFGVGLTTSAKPWH